MQRAKVVITSALILAVCAERLPEGKECYITECKIAHCSCYAKVGYSKLIDCGMLTSSLVIIGMKTKLEKYFIVLLRIHINELIFKCDV